MTELICGIGNVLIYFVAAVSVILPLRFMVHINDEIFRKILHFILIGSLWVWTISFVTWWIEVATVIGFVVAVYPILMFFERFKKYSETVTERKRGELKNSLIAVFLMFSIVIAVTEGVFRDEYLTLASIFAWGIGDAFAALIGKKYGIHKLKGKFLSGKKSLEGTLAMFACSFASVMALLMMRGGLHTAAAILTAFVTAAVSTASELYTKDGMDTVTCPLASMTVMLVCLYFQGGL